MAEALVSFATSQLHECATLQSTLAPTRALLKTVETTHNYADNLDEYWPIHFPGAKRLKLVFDNRCSTEHNCDFVAVYRDHNHSPENRVTNVNYTGRANDAQGKNWPGVGGRPPLYIEADKCDIHFHRCVSFGEKLEWNGGAPSNQRWMEAMMPGMLEPPPSAFSCALFPCVP